MKNEVILFSKEDLDPSVTAQIGSLLESLAVVKMKVGEPLNPEEMKDFPHAYIFTSEL